MLSPMGHHLHHHIPVMLNEILELAEPALSSSTRDKSFLDCTLGRGGHFRAILEKYPVLRSAIGLDQDSQAIAEVQQTEWWEGLSQGKCQLFHTNFVDFSPPEASPLFDFILVDLGVSSPQLDQAERGFSFYLDGPLDMRMNRDQELTAEKIVNEFSEDELINLFKTLGEIHRPEKVVRAIVKDRQVEPWLTTSQLAKMIERVDGWRVKGKHPATLYFLALRLAVNQELERVSVALPKMIEWLKPGGRLAVISFHSLEDRIVKFLFQGRFGPLPGEAVKRKAFKPSEEEMLKNPRARSALLRVFEKNQT